MRLLQVQADGSFSLVNYVGENIPPYAILSHTWGADDEEVTFKDLRKDRGKIKPGYCKLSFCGKQAANDGLQFIWIDTCCIDKSSSTELSEAINSMFQWYHKAAKCYVYLSDVSAGNSVRSDLCSRQTWEPDFQGSRWFTRGWTLQELLAPKSVEFFSAEGKRLGNRITLLQEIHKVTGIPIKALQGSPLSHFSVNERKSWAANRQTKREEDAAYSLLGIFDVHMPLLYGEGRRKAFARMERKTKKSCEVQPMATVSLRPFAELSKYNWVLLSPHPSGEGSDLMEQSNVPSFSRAFLDVSNNVVGHKDSGFELCHGVPEPESNKPGLQVRATAAGTLGRGRQEVHDLQHELLDLEAVLKQVLNHACYSVDIDERTRSRSCNDIEGYDKAFVDMLELRKGNTKDKKTVSVPRLIDNELGAASKCKGNLGGQVEMFQNTTNTLCSSCIRTRSVVSCYIAALPTESTVVERNIWVLALATVDGNAIILELRQPDREGRKHPH